MENQEVAVLAVLIESLVSKIDAVADGVKMVNEKMERGFQEINTKIDNLETRINKLETKNSEEHQLLKQMINELSEEQNQIKKTIPPKRIK